MAEVKWETPAPQVTETKAPTAPMEVTPRRQKWKTEILSYYQVMKEFNNMDPSDTFRSLSQFTARASEMRAIIAEHESRTEAAFRIKVIDPFIEECDRQFKIHSRILSNEEMIAKLAGGRFT